MRSLTNNKLIGAVISALMVMGSSALAADLKLAHPSIGYWNFNETASLVFIEDNGQIDWVQNHQITKQDQYKINDAGCQPSKADTMAGEGLVLSWPYLVGINRVCLIDASSKTIHAIANIPTPDNAYSTTFLTEDQNFSYFVVLGRPFKTLGYLKLWVIDKKNHVAVLKDFFVNVPDYSGGVWNESGTLYVTLSVYDPVAPQNNLYTLDLKTLTSLLPKAGNLDFSSYFKISQGPFPGFSAALIGGSKWFLYFNEGYDSFFLNKDSGDTAAAVIADGCKPIGVQSNQLIGLCGGQTVKALSAPQ